MDQKTIDAFIEGSEHAFAQVYARYAPKVLTFGRRMLKDEALAQDFTQELMTRVWLQREKFRNVDNFEHYIGKMARNLFLRGQEITVNRNHLLNRYLNEADKPVHNDLEHQFIDSDYQVIIERALSTVSRQAQMIYRLSRHQHLSSKEIANRLQLSRQTVDNEMSAVLKKIRLYLKSHTVSVIVVTTAGWLS